MIKKVIHKSLHQIELTLMVSSCYNVVFLIIERSCFNDLKLVMSSSKVVKNSKLLPPLPNDLVMKFIWSHFVQALRSHKTLLSLAC